MVIFFINWAINHQINFYGIYSSISVNTNEYINWVRNINIKSIFMTEKVVSINHKLNNLFTWKWIPFDKVEHLCSSVKWFEMKILIPSFCQFIQELLDPNKFFHSRMYLELVQREEMTMCETKKTLYLITDYLKIVPLSEFLQKL